MSNQTDRVTTSFLGMAKIFARTQGDIERVLRITGRAVGPVVVAILGCCWASRPAGSHRQPLSEPSVRLSPHWAPIRQTCRSYQSASARRDSRDPEPAVAETGSREPYRP